MALNRDQKIIVTSADGTRRRRLPALQVTGAEARVERYGGYGQFTVSTAVPYSAAALPSIVKGDRVEMYYQGTLRYRGYIEERTQSEGEPDTLALVGYGMSFLVGQQLCAGRYAYAGVGVDIAAAFGEIVRDAASPRSLTAPVGRLGMPLFGALQALTTGTTTTFVDGYRKLLKDVLNDLVQNQAGNLAVWGGDVDAFGQDRLYLRPISPATFPPQHALLVPSRQVEAAQSEDQAGDLKNRVLLTGAQPRFPQLVHNGGFDLPVVFQQGDSGLIQDGDFESKSWSLSGGSSYKDAGHQEGQPFSGTWMVEMDHPGEAADKSGTFAAAPVTGHNYVFSVRAKKEVGLQVADGSGFLKLFSSANSLLLTVPLLLTPGGTSWDYFSATFLMPPGVAQWQAHFQSDHVSAYNGDTGGLLIDAVSLEDSSVVYQEGWQIETFGSAQFAAVNWVYKDASYDGLYCAYVSPRAADADGQDCWVVPLGRARITVLFKQSLRLSLRYRSPLGAALGLPKMKLQLDWARGDGSDISTDSLVIPSAPASTTWQYAELVASAPSDAASVLARINPRSNGDLLIDAISVQDAQALSSGGVPMDTASGPGGTPDGHPGYLPEGPLSTLLTATASSLGGAWAASESTYGSRTDISGEGGVDTLPGLTRVATGRLRNTALPLTRPSLTRVSDPRVYLPGESIALLGRHGQALSGGQVLTIAAVSIRLGDQFKTVLEIDKEQPSADLIVKRLILDQFTKNGPGASSGGGGGGGYSNPVSGGGGQSAAYRSTLQASATDPTLHDAFVGVPHASAASQSGWTGTGAEVAAGRTRTVKGVSAASLEARLDLMEVDIAAGGSAKAAASVFGTVETDITEAGGSVVYTKTTADSRFAAAASLTSEATLRGNADAAETTARTSGDALALKIASNLSDLNNAVTARTNLGLGTAATKDVSASGNAAAGQLVLGSDTRLGAGGISITESIGNGADLALTTAYQTVPTISIAVAANAAVDADALVEVAADGAAGGDDLYLQLYDTVGAAAIPFSERHVSNIAAGKRGQILLSKYVPGIAGGRTLVLQAKNATAARGSLNTNRSLLQVLGVASGNSTGGGITSPTQVAGMVYWLQGSGITGLADGAAVASWPDSSGNSHSASQATSANQPIYKASGLNSKPVVRFDGSSQFMMLGNLSSYFPSAATLFVVVTYNGSQHQCVYSTTPFNSGTNAGDDFWYFLNNGGSYFSVFGSARSANYGVPMTTTGSNLYSVVATPTTGEVWLNQTDKGSFSQTFTGGTNHLIGHSNNSANNIYLNADISEIIAYSAALSATDRLNVEGYLKAKYGI